MIHPERIPLLRGEGRYVDDIRLPGTAHLAFVRSPHAHARVVRVNVAAARAAPGVVAVFTGEDLAPHIRPIRARLEPPPTDRYQITEWHPIARERVRFVGEIVAVVVAEDRYEAEDAAEMAEVDYEALPAVSGVDAARAAGAPTLHSQAPDNVLYFTRRTAVADGCEDPFEHAPVKVHISVRHPRIAALSMEGAAALARFDPATSNLELTTSTQIPHLVRDGLSLCLDMDEKRIRVIAPDVGGGFGPKAQLYPEEVVVAHLARVLGRPVKWVQDRGEHLAASFHARDVRMKAELAADRNGIILGVRARALCAVGAYSAFPFTSALEPQTIGAGLSGPYRVPYYDYEGVALATNAYPGGAYRGVGFPLGPLCMETLLERVAKAIGEDPVQVRRRNLVTPDELPRRGPTGALYDSGDYPALLDMALSLGGYEALRRRQRDSASDRHRLGLGIACFTEFSATNGELVRRRGLTHVPGFDSALVRVTADGAVEACLSTPSQGQSQPTTFARVLADALGVEPESVRIVLGDTGLTPYGSGTFVSRSLVSGGGALRLAARKLRERMCELAALLWQVDGADVAFAEGAVSHRHDAAKRLTLAEMGAIVHSASHEVPAGWDARLEAQASYDPPSMPVSAASHLAVVAVDTQTGAVDIKRYLVAEDCGPMVDQDVVEGQIRGAVAQGIGSALHEEVHYDAAGQLLTGTLQDYLVPSIFDVPRIEIVHMCTPSPFTEGGYKGMAEGGTIGAPAAIVNAVSDALGVYPDEVRLPLTPERVLALASDREVCRSPERAEPQA